MKEFSEDSFFDSEVDQKETEIHLCNNFRHLMFALVDVIGRSSYATIIYLEDNAPISDSLKKKLSETYPRVSIHYTKDKLLEVEFSGIPFTKILRRNLKFSLTSGFTFSGKWCIPFLKNKRFKIGYIYHPGFFASKAISCSCDRIVMRESGLNNYVTIRVPWPKALIRAAFGLPPFKQVWGQERWIDKIEISIPEELPPSIQNKAHCLTFRMLIDRVSEAELEKLVSIFTGAFPITISLAQSPRALLLTQPLDKIGFCKKEDNNKIYQDIADMLTKKGYALYVKNHPDESVYILQGGKTLDIDFPIELWTATGLPKFDLAVAICSASLIEGETLVASKIIQLLTPSAFNAAFFAHWHKSLPANLIQLESTMIALEES